LVVEDDGVVVAVFEVDEGVLAGVLAGAAAGEEAGVEGVVDAV
jgi:hypothetical protein